MAEFCSMFKSIGTALIVATGLLFDTTSQTATTPDICKRETVGTLTNAEGVIRKIDEASVYMIYCKQQHLKLNVVNLAQPFRQADLKVIFSGNIKNTHPMEDNWGEFFEVTEIK